MRPRCGELVAHGVDVQSQFAFLQPFTHGSFLGFAGLTRLERRSGFAARDDAHPVVVGDHHVTRIYQAASADNGYIHRAQGLLYRSLGVYGLGPDGEAHGSQLAHVADAGIDDQAAHAACGERAGQELTEIARI